MVKIISDSTCDLSPDLLQKYDIDILPLHILLEIRNTGTAGISLRMRSLRGPMRIRQLRRLLHRRLWMRWRC